MQSFQQKTLVMQIIISKTTRSLIQDAEICYLSVAGTKQSDIALYYCQSHEAGHKSDVLTVLVLQGCLLTAPSSFTQFQPAVEQPHAQGTVLPWLPWAFASAM